MFWKTSKQRILIHVLILLGFILLAFFINKIPQDHSIAQGDFYQVINLKENYSRYAFTWFNHYGQGMYNNVIPAFPFYMFGTLLETIGLSNNLIAQATMFLFLYLSFLSFYFSLRIIQDLFQKEMNESTRIFAGLFYAFNPYTFGVFSFSWGYTHHLLLYIFIPLILGLFMRILVRRQPRDIAYLAILFFVSTVGFSNVAFLIALLLFQLAILIFFSLTRLTKINKELIAKVLLVFFVQLILCSYFLVPFISSQRWLSSEMGSSKVYGDIWGFMKDTSVSLNNVFRFANSRYAFPLKNFYQDNFVRSLTPKITAYLPWLLLIVLLFMYKRIRQKDISEYRFLLSTASILLIFALLITRMEPPFERATRFLYHLPGSMLFRSPDKFLIFYPFFLAIAIALAFSHIDRSLLRKSLLAVLLLTITFPFFVGGVTTYVTTGLASNIMDVVTDGYKIAVKLPDEYYDTANMVNGEKGQLSILSLPYSVGNSINWSNYPKWNFVGYDFSYLLYDKLYISANTFDNVTETEMSFKDYAEQNVVDKDRFLGLLQRFSTGYVILHKDIEEFWVDNSRVINDTIASLENDGALFELTDNQYFAFYKLSGRYRVPLIYADKCELSFQKINPTKYVIRLRGVDQRTSIAFHQSFNPQWKLYLRKISSDDLSNPVESYANTNTVEFGYDKARVQWGDLLYLLRSPVFDNTHSMIEDYANGWIIDPQYIKENFGAGYCRENPDGTIDIEIVIYFKPQSYYYLGLIISILTLLACLVYLYLDRRRSKRRPATSTEEEQ